MGGNKNIPTKRKCIAILQFRGIGAYTALFTVVYTAPTWPLEIGVNAAIFKESPVINPPNGNVWRPYPKKNSLPCPHG
jgi:hypothetical protein